MENKYYEIIKKIVVNHRKYPGLEAILEDIILDVQERGSIVIKNITNADVVESYLTKIVSTSIITVPKRMNYNIKTNHRVINSQILDININEKSDETISKDISAITDTLDIVDTQNLMQELEDISIYDNSETVEFEEPTQTEETYKTDEIDITLVDKMINGVNSSEQNNEVKTTNDVSLNIEDLDTVALVEDITSSGKDNDKNFDFEVKEETLENVEQDFRIDLSQEEVSGLEEEVLEDVEQNFNIDLTQKEVSDLEEEVLEDVEQDFNIDLSQEEVSDLEEKEEEFFENTEDEQSEDIIEKTLHNNFQVFDYLPEKTNINEEEIITEINKLNNKNPDSYIIEILELKYKDKLSIEEIARKMNKDIDFILKTLNDIIDIVKE